MLNVVNFGGGTYVLYAEIDGDEIEVDADTYGDNFARPARLLPLEAKALVAAIDLFGDHLPQAGLSTRPREDRRARSATTPPRRASRSRPARDDSDGRRAPSTTRSSARRVLELHYYKENEDEFTKREVEPYQLANGPEGWYVGCYDLGREDIRHFRLDRIKEATITERELRAARGSRGACSPSRSGWSTARSRPPASPASGSRPSAPAGCARSAPWSRSSPTAPSWSSCPTARADWLVREVLKGAGDFVVLEPERRPRGRRSRHVGRS